MHKSAFILLLGFIFYQHSFAQKLDLEWNGSSEDLIRLIEGGKVRFTVSGESSGVPDKITFKIKTEPTDELMEVMTLVEDGFVGIGTTTPNAKLEVDGGIISHNTPIACGTFQPNGNLLYNYQVVQVTRIGPGFYTIKLPKSWQGNACVVANMADGFSTGFVNTIVPPDTNIFQIWTYDILGNPSDRQTNFAFFGLLKP